MNNIMVVKNGKLEDTIAINLHDNSINEFIRVCEKNDASFSELTQDQKASVLNKRYHKFSDTTIFLV